MVIGIIGANISGLIAGKRLAKAGHDVTIIEKDRTLGGRLSTIELDDVQLDIGVTHFEADTHTFKSFVQDWESEGVVRKWTDKLALYDGQKIYDVNPNTDPKPKYIGTKGNQSIADKLGRWVDIKSEEKAGGLTYIGPDRSAKRSWMINMTDISVFECDAVIIATPAVEAYGLLMTTQNKTATRKITRHVDEIQYDAIYSLAVTYEEDEVPEWKGIYCEDSPVKWISNEASKQNADKAALVIQSTDKFFREHAQKSDEKVKELLLKEAADVAGKWIRKPKSTYLHRWKYFEARNTIDEYFMELEMADGPLALIGDYLGGTTEENAFVSGYNLAEYWINKYSEVTV